MRMSVALLGALAIACGATYHVSRAADEARPKYTIKEVMKLAHKDGLLKKVTSGQGSKEDAEKLVELYTAMCADKPPKGEESDWKTRTTALVQAAKDAAANKDGAKAELEKAANCAACHKLHKPA